MSKHVSVLLVDAFTTTPGKGNRAGVVLDASGLTTEEMQAVAKTVNVSETAFMIPASDRDGYDLEVRYFTPSIEVPICGHATIGSHFARAEAFGINKDRLVAKTGAGILPVDIVTENGVRKIVMTQGSPSLTPPYDDSICCEIHAALGLTLDDVSADLPIQEASTGHSKVMVPIKSVETLDGMTPDMEGLTKCSNKIGCNGFFVFAFNDAPDLCLTSGRMFAPAIGIEEDPVTGNANGPCGYYLTEHGVLPDEKKHTYKGRQGVAMGKAGIIEVIVHRHADGSKTIQVAGTAVDAGEITVELNDDGSKAAAKAIGSP